MKYFIPTYNQAVAITGGTEDLFYSREQIIDGYKIVIFNYRLAQYKDFIEPVGAENAFEMRGITFVFYPDGTLYKRFLLLNKFFNLNQVEMTLYDNVKDLKIKNVYIKEDGSVISFIRLPNGRTLAKSKMSFDNDQANGSNQIYNSNSNIKEFVNWTLENDITAIFEYVSYDNRIVLKYLERDLILLRLRDNKTGEYLNLDDFTDKLVGISVVKKVNHTLDELIEMSKSDEDIEGWVVQFECGKMIKIKTKWYFSLHHLFTEDIHRENLLIGHILDGNIDDILSKIDLEYSSAIDRINEITDFVQNWIKNKIKSVNDTYLIYKTMTRKDFAISYKDHDDFNFVMTIVNNGDLYSKIIEYIRRVTYRLESARTWLGNDLCVSGDKSPSF